MAANRFNPTSRNAISSAPTQEPDDISLFLQQIILRSASSPSLSANARHHTSAEHVLGRNEGPETGLGQIRLPDQHPPVLNSSSGFSFPRGNASSSSAGKHDSEADEYDYESEEVIEAEVEEIAPKPTPRSSSKRSRAAEVHNLSEKRRRSRINEKMKALQNLIPNSNKTDKASMLDEAIEYLKQLQLQVQMLTMRNGLSLYPICMPEILQLNHQVSETRMDTYDSDKFPNLNMSKSICMDQRMQTDTLLFVQDKCVKQTPVTDFSSFIDSKASFQVGSSHFGSFQNSKAYKEACEEKVQLGIPLDDDRHQMSSTRSKGTSSIPLERNTGNLKENSLEAGLAGEDHILNNLVNLPIFSSQSNL